ncbi:MAG: transposase [Flavobacteriaceae bacterium]|nr:transposase [Flavobacteriaceae bacterium]
MIHDRFHLIPYLNKAIDQVRRREVKKQAGLKKARLAILKNEDNRTEKQKVIFQRVQESHGEVRRVWKLKADVQSLFESSNWKEASSYLQLWMDSVLQSGIQEVCAVAKRFQNHCQGVGHALCYPQSNAKAERLSGRIQEIKVIRLSKVRKF